MKHFQSHWKELLATKAVQEKPEKQPAGDTSDTTTDAAESEADSQAANGARARSNEDVETLGRWDRARDFLHRYRYWALAASLSVLAVCLVAVYGRGDGRADRVRVSGQVFLDDKPLTTGTILFLPEKGGRPSVGTIDESGHFTLTCYERKDGAVLGRHHIEIIPSKAIGEDDSPWPVPLKYRSQETSGLTADIQGPTDDLKLTVASDKAATPPEAEPDPQQARPQGT